SSLWQKHLQLVLAAAHTAICPLFALPVSTPSPLATRPPAPRPPIRKTSRALGGFEAQPRWKARELLSYRTPTVSGQRAAGEVAARVCGPYAEVSPLHATVALAPPVPQGFGDGGAFRSPAGRLGRQGVRLRRARGAATARRHHRSH